ncbi:MAG: Cysteine--tRNA ligase [candidate division WS2 bacterium ADurb.Bin280]|uniref:Cysteine--tRNA ligase n=1 Tax=candidate division WS2 bacterium ADurb.Bin280 TaxID=1852829 RepID=A0A1V5SD72_9BACT|nr:MAG: Cysteine--tRNA ligase [candidate division WS2 bacterium ADurb.Bin280]
MKLKIYNTLSRSKQEVTPISGDTIRMYSCGLTVYDFAHIGNLRKYVFDDLLRRTLKYFGYKVKWVMNITDVGHLTSDQDEGEDKIEKGARKEGKSAFEIAEFYKQAFIDNLKKLNIDMPDVLPSATGHIKEQIELISKLESRGFVYKTDDGIYFDTSKLDDYGKLARLDKENLQEGARIEINPQKKNPTDFALWKFSYPQGRDFDQNVDDQSKRRQMEWPSPWGLGFPGWHVECSAMSTKYLGQPFEIHTGGVDHINIHHTNEIAQSEAAEGKELARYWVHSEHLLENGKKMAKSDGHFIRLMDLEERGFDPVDLRFFYLRSHYRSKIDFSYQSLEGSRSARRKIVDFCLSLESGEIEGEDLFYREKMNEFDEALSDDLNTPRALEVIFTTITEAANKSFRGAFAKKFFEKIDEVLALDLFKNPFESIGFSGSKEILIASSFEQEVAEISKEMALRKEQGDFFASDELRAKLVNMGYVVEESQKQIKIYKK